MIRQTACHVVLIENNGFADVLNCEFRVGTKKVRRGIMLPTWVISNSVVGGSKRLRVNRIDALIVQLAVLARQLRLQVQIGGKTSVLPADR